MWRDENQTFSVTQRSAHSPTSTRCSVSAVCVAASLSNNPEGSVCVLVFFVGIDTLLFGSSLLHKCTHTFTLVLMRCSFSMPCLLPVESHTCCSHIYILPAASITRTNLHFKTSNIHRTLNSVPFTWPQIPDGLWQSLTMCSYDYFHVVTFQFSLNVGVMRDSRCSTHSITPTVDYMPFTVRQQKLLSLFLKDKYVITSPFQLFKI